MGRGSKNPRKTILAHKNHLGVRQSYPRKAKQERTVLQPVLKCDVAKLIAGRTDSKLLKKHLQEINLHRQKWVMRQRVAREKLKKGDASEAHKIPSYKAKVTEAQGEHEATLLMVSNYTKEKYGATYHLLWPFSAGTGIDQLWWSEKDDTYIIVEAKGPGAILSTNAAKGDQMSKMWVKNSLESVKNSPKATDTDKKHAEQMLAAMAVGPPPEVYGRVIEALPGGGAKEVGCPDKGIYHKQLG